MVSHEGLMDMAREAAQRAYAPYSGFRVGAAILSSDGGECFTGCNVENASYGLTICAERVAAGSAVAAGHRELETVAVYADGPELPMPCGACRQFLAEFNPKMVVIVSNGSSVRTHRLDELLPYSFGPAVLQSPEAKRKPQRGGGR
jgi:cytidine deaminase